MVPKGWESLTFDDAQISIIDGDRGTEYPKASDFYEDEACLFLSAKNVTSSGFKFDDIQFISYEKHQRLRKGTVNRFDLVLTTRGSVGNFAYYDQDVPYDLIRINSGMVVIRSLESKLDSKFLYTTCTSSLIQKQIERAAFGSAQPQLTVSIIKNFTVPVPPLPEQRKIAQILSTWDKAIATTERLLANKQQQKKALMQRLLTGKDLLGDVQGRRSKFKLKSLTAKDQTNSFIDGDWIESPHITESGIRLIQTGNIGIGAFVDKNKRYISEDSFTSLNCKEVKVGDLLICRLAEPAGRACVVPDIQESKMITSVDVTIVRVNTTLVIANYLEYYFSLPSTLYMVASLCGGSTRSRISRSNLGEMLISIPSLSEQKRIVSILSTADMEITITKHKLDNLKLQKKALMQQLLTGKRRVKVDEAAA